MSKQESTEKLTEELAHYLAAKDLQGWAFRASPPYSDAAAFERRRYLARAAEVLAIVERHGEV